MFWTCCQGRNSRCHFATALLHSLRDRERSNPGGHGFKLPKGLAGSLRFRSADRAIPTKIVQCGACATRLGCAASRHRGSKHAARTARPPPTPPACPRPPPGSPGAADSSPNAAAGPRVDVIRETIDLLEADLSAMIRGVEGAAGARARGHQRVGERARSDPPAQRGAGAAVERLQARRQPARRRDRGACRLVRRDHPAGRSRQRADRAGP